MFPNYYNEKNFKKLHLLGLIPPLGISKPAWLHNSDFCLKQKTPVRKGCLWRPFNKERLREPANRTPACALCQNQKSCIVPSMGKCPPELNRKDSLPRVLLSGREDLNLRPLAPHASALAGLRHAPRSVFADWQESIIVAFEVSCNQMTFTPDYATILLMIVNIWMRVSRLIEQTQI